ncbi:MAG: hypothetical protein J2P31_17170, partial [Blastocatellia bacterium]|nr:hypothetical protein [Blastocatellia bacterium]
MLVQSSPRQYSLFSLLSLIAGGVVIVVACYALLAWIIDIDFLSNAIPGWPRMTPVIAFCFILSGFSLCFQGPSPEEPSQTYAMDWERIFLSLVSQRRLALASALTVTLASLLGLSYHYHKVLGFDLAIIATAIIPDNLTAMIALVADQMQPNLSLFFLLVGSALLLLHVGTHRGIRTMQSLALVVWLTALVAALNYIFGMHILSAIDLWPRMAPHEAFSFLCLSLGLVFARPESGLMGFFTSERLSGHTGRRLLIAVIVLPAVAGGLYLYGSRVGFYDTRRWLPLLIASNVVVFLVALWLNIVSLRKCENKRLQDLAALREVNAGLERQVQEQMAEVMRANHDIWSELQERVRMEEELRFLSEQLEKERERTQAYEKEAQERIEEAVGLRAQFLVSVTEEM